MKNLKSLYLYLICLITFVIFITSSITTINNVTDLFIDTTYQESFESYEQQFIKRNEDNQSIEYIKPIEEIKNSYNEKIEHEKDFQKKRNIKSIINGLFAMIISIGFWLYHWKIVQKENKE